MSTATLTYSEVVRIRRAPAIRQILVLSSLVLIGNTTLMTEISANADLTDRTALSKNSAVGVPVPVQTAPTVTIQPVPSETSTPASDFAGRPTALPVPAATPPSQ